MTEALTIVGHGGSVARNVRVVTPFAGNRTAQRARACEESAERVIAAGP